MRSRRPVRRALSVIAVATVSLLAAAYATTATHRAVTKIAIATPEKADDFGWNEQGVAGARAAGAAKHVSVVVADNLGFGNVGPQLRQLAARGAGLIIAHGPYDVVARDVSSQFNVPVIIYPNVAPKPIPGRVASITTNSQEGSYLAGVLAAKTTKTNTLGLVLSADDVNEYKQSGGFVAGARSVNAKIKFLFVQMGPANYSDAAGAKRATQAVISQGADIVFGMGDGASFGMLQAVETATPPAGAGKVWFIDVIGDKSALDKHHVYLSSVVWSFPGVFENAIQDLRNGTFGTHNYTLTVKNGGIYIVKRPFVPASIWAAVVAARKRVASGAVHVPVVTTKAQLTRALK